jgi:hypothetical protein
LPCRKSLLESTCGQQRVNRFDAVKVRPGFTYRQQ